MPKKFQGENSKAAVAKARKAGLAAEEKARKEQEKDDALWQEDDKLINKKFQRKVEREQKRQTDLQRKIENKTLAELEVTELVPENVAPKVTLFQLQTAKESQKSQEEIDRRKEEKASSHLDAPLVENLNRAEPTDSVVGSGIDEAISALSCMEDSNGGEVDRHPERRMAAAFRAYEAQMMPQFKKQNPSLRLSQLKQLLRKEWIKSPQNPINQQ